MQDNQLNEQVPEVVIETISEQETALAATATAEPTAEATPVVEAAQAIEVVEIVAETAPVVEAAQAIEVVEIVAETAPVVEAAQAIEVEEIVAETAPVVEAAQAIEIVEIVAETAPVVEIVATDVKPEAAKTAKRREKTETVEVEAQKVEPMPEPEVDYTTMGLQDAIKAFEALCTEPIELSKVQGRVVGLRKHIQDTITQEITEKKSEFVAQGNDEANFKPEPNALYRRFNDANVLIKERRSKERDLQDAERNANLAAKQAILDRLKEIIDNSEAAAAFEEFKKLQEKWRSVGAVPAEKNQEIWERYTFYLEKVYDDFKISKELRMLDLKKNLEHKTQLCEKAESLLLKDSVGDALKDLSILHDEWKTVGPVPNEQRETIWDRFKIASDKVYDKRKEYYDSLDDERKNNYALKLQLCEQAQALAGIEPQTHKDWEELTQKYAEIQADWRKVGLAPREVNEEIWQQFKALGDAFYNAKNLFYKNIREEQSQNYNLRMELCARAEALMNSDDWKLATDEFVKIQKEWKDIGAIGRKQSEKLWQRFQAACNAFFERKKLNFAGKDVDNAQNLQLKTELIERIEAFAPTDSGNEDFETLKAFQREWINIGYVPIKDKKTTEDRYRKAIDAHFDAIKLSRNEQGKARYQTKIEGMKTVANPSAAFRREGSELSMQISKLSADIALWENNIEFFSRSKNADALRKEIQTKIDKAQSDIKLLKDKQKLLNQ